MQGLLQGWRRGLLGRCYRDPDPSSWTPHTSKWDGWFCDGEFSLVYPPVAYLIDSKTVPPSLAGLERNSYRTTPLPSSKVKGKCKKCDMWQPSAPPSVFAQEEKGGGTIWGSLQALEMAVNFACDDMSPLIPSLSGDYVLRGLSWDAAIDPPHRCISHPTRFEGVAPFFYRSHTVQDTYVCAQAPPGPGSTHTTRIESTKSKMPKMVKNA